MGLSIVEYRRWTGAANRFSFVRGVPSYADVMRLEHVKVSAAAAMCLSAKADALGNAINPVAVPTRVLVS